MSHSLLQQPFDFLSQLQRNNNRNWFNEHKATYLSAHEEVITFAEHLHHQLSSSDHLETINGKKSLHRIYRDVRFSKDKTPYSSYFGGGFRRATAALRGGYYYHLEPQQTSIIGGFWNPSTQDLLHIRKHIQQDSDTLRDILNSRDFKVNFGTLEGEQLKTYPRGFDPEDPAIDLLRYKQFLIRHKFTHEESLSENFFQMMAEQFKNMRPFLDYMSEILTTDLNGESII